MPPNKRDVENHEEDWPQYRRYVIHALEEINKKLDAQSETARYDRQNYDRRMEDLEAELHKIQVSSAREGGRAGALWGMISALGTLALTVLAWWLSQLKKQ